MKRRILLCILLSIISCGLYLLYWMYSLNGELNKMADNKEYPNGITVIVITVASCGIYGLIWSYKMSKCIKTITESHGDSDPKYGALFILLNLFGLFIINYAIMQKTVNKYAIDV
ncbi:MAG: DUF4234 domain-containing protein [Ruminococcaceae bacterium]|nr:DUF4234 domain-containing protein [Oscillospiraceae bacterium]